MSTLSNNVAHRPVFASKAATLAQLAVISQNEKSCFVVPGLVYFNAGRWADEADAVLTQLQARFAGQRVAVRSSAQNEDGALASQAGAFDSLLDVVADDGAALRRAIEAVLASYSKGVIQCKRSAIAGIMDSASTRGMTKGRHPAQTKRSSRTYGFRVYARNDKGASSCASEALSQDPYHPHDEVLVQQMVAEIDASGVILTRCVDDGSPYYVFAYDDESGSSDSVTAGRGQHKTVLLYRQARPEHCDSPRLRQMLALARELESLFGGQPLDIEFALDKKGVMHLLQVRRIASVREWHPDAEYRVARALPQIERFIGELQAPRPGLLGQTTLLGNMPDWNPAELIGVIPSPLAASLYRELISAGTWHQARSEMGYRNLPPTELLVLLAGHAFIDVRASFNSFLPAGLPDVIGEKLVNHWLKRLAEHPALHDKVEFALVPTVLDFDLTARIGQDYAEVLNPEEQAIWLEKLATLTRNIVQLEAPGSLTRAEASINILAARPLEALPADTAASARLAHIRHLLHLCRKEGCRAFSILARHGFVAEALLRSAVRRCALSEARLAAFKASIHTVMGDLATASRAVAAGQMPEAEFMERFGHLRPGTFDLLSPCYRDRPALFAGTQPQGSAATRQPFELSAAECNTLEALLAENRLHTEIDAQGLLDYARRAIQGREYGKFVFTRHLSAALEEIAAWGAQLGLGREELSFLRLEEIFDTALRSTRMEPTSELMLRVDQARLDRTQARAVRLSYLVRGVRDAYVVPLHRAEPTFITQERVEAPVLRLSASAVGDEALAGRIICIENADPGFDWIFTREIAGLVTQYGGANSHMAIRCAELQLPAAIGCGSALFGNLGNARRLLLDCGSRRMEVLE